MPGAPVVDQLAAINSIAFRKIDRINSARDFNAGRLLDILLIGNLAHTGDKHCFSSSCVEPTQDEHAW